MKAILKDKTLFIYPEIQFIASKIESLRDSILKELEDNHDFSHIVLDVDGIDVVDSLGVNLIIGIYRQAASDSKTFEIIGASKNFMKIANFFRFSSIFKVHAKEGKK